MSCSTCCSLNNGNLHIDTLGLSRLCLKRDNQGQQYILIFLNGVNIYVGEGGVNSIENTAEVNDMGDGRTLKAQRKAEKKKADTGKLRRSEIIRSQMHQVISHLFVLGQRPFVISPSVSSPHPSRLHSSSLEVREGSDQGRIPASRSSR
ncbi:hypothetical protein CDAR_106171 [Caerostris darwini]|uniref:Uncharacterized protein n=1 Tax=Caerostris darwini TaxID=1538125 RepID=A0AAV4NVB3_9ARAC|nr:hypothetical protein CDAR_106171 [Caerostris darwini]